MPTWSRGERTVTTVRFTVPTYERGAAWNQVQQALSAAIQEYTRTYGGSPSDDVIRVIPEDDAIVIEFTAPRPQGIVTPLAAAT